MDKNTKRWISTMEWFSKYWGCHQLPERSFSCIETTYIINTK